MELMIKRLLQHAPTAVVAVAVIGISLAYGGYGLTARGTVAIAVWWAIILGLGLALLPFRRPTREAYVTGGLLAGLGVLAALSVSWSASPGSSFVEFNRITLYLGFFILAVLAGTRANIPRWSDGLALGIAALGLLALTTRLFPGFVPGSGEVTEVGNARARLAFPLGYWNALGMLMAIGLPLILRGAVNARTKVTRGLAVGVIPALSAVIFLTSSRGAVAAGLIGVTVFVVLSRPRLPAAWAALSAAAGSAVIVALMTTFDALVQRPFRDPSVTAAQGRVFALIAVGVCVVVGFGYLAGVAGARSRRQSLPSVRVGRGGRVVLAALAATALVALVVAADPVQRIEGFKDPGFGKKEQQSTDARLLRGGGGGRYQFWSAAVDQFQANPVFGGGAGAYESWWAANPRFPYFVRNAHSLWLETLGELGVVGFVLLLGAFGYGLVTALGRLGGLKGPERVTLAALSGALLAWAFAAAIDWMWEMTVVTGVAVICLGLLSRTGNQARSSEEAPARPRRGSRSFGVGVAVIAAAWLVICAQASPLLSELRMTDSRAAEARGDFDSALQAARGARTLQPWASAPYRRMALVEEERGRLGPAREYIAQAIEREPRNFELWSIASRIESSAGNPVEARQRLDRSQRLNPKFSAAATVTP